MCDIGFGGEYAQVWRADRRKARKEHLCDACRRRIAPGEMYVIHASLYDGYWSEEKGCLECEELRLEFQREHRGPGTALSGLVETLEECIEWDEESEKRWGPKLEALCARGESGARA